MSLPSGPTLICYDGSQKAVEAIEYAAGLLGSTPAVVVTAWKPLVEETLAGAGAKPPIADPAEANIRQRAAAKELAREGATRAEQAGLEAEALVVETTGAIWEAIEEAAHERDARVIVCGTNRSGLRAALPGSVANALVQHASRPVLVKPSAVASAERRREFTSRKLIPRRHHAETASDEVGVPF
jgi:nucleotide-binding universal stress UspA family protein